MAEPELTLPVDHATLVFVGDKSHPGHKEACRRALRQVYKVVAAVLGPKSADIGDVTQEAFLRVYKNVSKFVYDPDKPRGPTAWINKVALRTALDHRSAMPPWEQMEDVPPEALKTMLREENTHAPFRRALASALLELLDERHRAILVLHYWNGETQEEIAETLSIPLGTVKTRMRVAHQKIRDYARQDG